MIKRSDDIENQGPKVLIITWSPVPTPRYQKIEGSGQRYFGLANGLLQNGINNVTIAIGTIYPLDVSEASGIKLFNYDFNDEFIAKLADYDTIIFNYAIHGADFIAKNMPTTSQVIIDAYGPAYIESLARNPTDIVGTYVGNLSAVNDVFNKVLPRGDYFLYANDAQEKFYTGVLATLGVINQFSYHTQRLVKVPFGIDVPDKSTTFDNPYLKFGIKKSDFLLLWFGGLYPWFDITDILKAIKQDREEKIKLVIVGGNNPQNQHPDFVKNYENVVKYIQDNELDKNVILIDWVDYATRRKYYEFADAIISLNGEGKENSYSWRTRVMDYVGSTTPLITNGGDPLSDELIEVGAAFKVDLLRKNNLQNLLVELSSNQKKLAIASDAMHKLQPKYYWKNLTTEISTLITSQSKPYSEEHAFRLENNITGTTTRIIGNDNESKKTIDAMARLLVRKVKEKGFKNTYKIAGAKVRRRVEFEYKKRFPKQKVSDPKIVIVSNQLNNTGAPFVIMDIVAQLRHQYPQLTKKIKFITFTPIEAANIIKLNQIGVNVDVYTNRELSIEFSQGDIVIFNSLAVSRTTIFAAINALNTGILKRIYWYGHEAAPDSFIDNDIKEIFKDYLKQGKAKIYAVSSKAMQNYTQFFEIEKNIEKMPFRFFFPEEYIEERDEKDFNELRFISTGSLMDMRKGQYPIIYAFLDFYHNFYKKSPEDYRNFHLSFIGAYEKSDTSLHAPYHIQNIKRQFDLAAEGLGKHVTIKASLSHDQALKEISAANVTICYSLNEALPIFVYEGMATGHPILRNESPGQEEQLSDGKNGFAVSSNDFAGLVDVIEKIMNKNKTTNKQLADMSKTSSRIAIKAMSNKYPIIDELYNLI